MILAISLVSVPSHIIALIIFGLMVGSYTLGYRLRLRSYAHKPDQQHEDMGTISGALIGLLALLLAFTFGMSNSRYDDRRKLVTEEANDISTVILKTDIYPDSVRAILRSHLRQYVEKRIEYHRAGADEQKIAEAIKQSSEIGNTIWSIAAQHAKKDGNTARTSGLIPALHDMLDIITTREATRKAMVPESILFFLFALALCSAFLMGYDRKNKFDWVVVIGFSLMLSATIFTILDLDRPRRGLITTDESNKNIVELLQMFNENE